MIARIPFNGKEFLTDLSKPLDISIPIQHGANNPSCYGADAVVFETIRTNDFVGSVREGGSVNYQKLQMTPHGNGTHTECVGHIIDNPSSTINKTLTQFHHVAELITVRPSLQANGDKVITLSSLREKLNASAIAPALVVRTLPNGIDKTNRQYMNTNPPFFEKEAIVWMVQHNIQHLLTDIPSVDKEKDDGKLSAHHAFWNTQGAIRDTSTITELIYVSNDILDGRYLVNLQIISLEMDASPSKPVLYKLTEVL